MRPKRVGLRKDAGRPGGGPTGGGSGGELSANAVRTSSSVMSKADAVKATPSACVPP